MKKRMDLELKIALVASAVFVISLIAMVIFVLLPMYGLAGANTLGIGSVDVRFDQLMQKRRILGFIGNVAMLVGVVSVAIWIVKTSRKK